MGILSFKISFTDLCILKFYGSGSSTTAINKTNRVLIITVLTVVVIIF